MKNANKPALPFAQILAFDKNGVPDEMANHLGLSKREYFAAHAPEMPGWFTRGIKLEPYKGVQPPRWQDQPEPFQEEARLWQQGEWNEKISEELEDFRKSVHEYHAELTAHDIRQRTIQLRAWRYYYADMMLAEEREEGGQQ